MVLSRLVSKDIAIRFTYADTAFRRRGSRARERLSFQCIPQAMRLIGGCDVLGSGNCRQRRFRYLDIHITMLIRAVATRAFPY